MPTAVQAPEQGQLVEVRARRWVVADVAVCALGATAHDPLATPQNLVTLRCVDDDAEPDETLDVIWEIEGDARLIHRAALPRPDHLDDPRRFDAFLDAVRWGSLSAARPSQLLAPFQSGIAIEDYQLEPLARAMEQARVALLIADDVGLGKTIEAGLIVKELLLRYRARRVLVVTPADLVMQWHDEMRDKFGLEFRIVDSALVKRFRRERGVHANPWTHFPRLITSIDYLKQERVLRRFRETLPGPNEPQLPRPWDLLVVDEAHNVAPAGRGRYVADSLRTRAVREIVDHVDHRLFLTATPHNGYDESFTALLELLDRSIVRGAPPSDEQKHRVMVRRLKSELPPDDLGRPRFPTRVLTDIPIDHSDDERRAHADLAEYARLRASHADRGTAKLATDFVLLLLKRRLVSSPRAFQKTLAVHRDTLAKPRPAAPAPVSEHVLRTYMEQADEPFESDDELASAQDEAHVVAVSLMSPLTPDETTLLHRLAAWAERAAGQVDTKATALIDLIEATCRPDGTWNDERIIVFTEFRDTQNWLLDLLSARKLTGDGRVEMLYGGMDPDERTRVKAAFQAAEAPVRVLVGTDAASEGINLQRHCHRVVHFEIPWNPVRLEQRNGRVDRHGQTAPEVLVYLFTPARLADPARVGSDPASDFDFLRKVATKVQSIRDMLGSVGPVISQQVRDAMLGRITELNTATAEASGNRVRTQLGFERDLKRRIDKVMDDYAETRAELHLSPEHVRTVVETGLSLAGQRPLVPVDGDATLFQVPALTGHWAPCTGGLAHPFTQVQRPISFDADVVRGRDDVVLCHVGHRLTQTALRLLRAEVFSADGTGSLARVTARVVGDPRLRHPLAVAYARLVVTGAEGHRLHEEVIQAGGSIVAGKLERLDVTALSEQLALTTSHEAPGVDVLQLHEKVADALARAIQARANDRARSLLDTIETRRAEEEGRVHAVLNEVRAHITSVLDRQHDQLGLFDADEHQQYTRDREFLRLRLGQLPEEIEREVAELTRRYRDPVEHPFPIAVEYRIPKALAQ